jgi:hypothetical protein
MSALSPATTAGPVSELACRHNEMAELVEVRVTVGDRRLLVGSFAGDLTIDLPPDNDGHRRINRVLHIMAIVQLCNDTKLKAAPSGPAHRTLRLPAPPS